MALGIGQPIFWGLLLVSLAGLALLAWRFGMRWWPAWPIRFALILLVLLAAFTPRSERESGNLSSAQILIVDQSDSIAASERESIQAQARVWATQRDNRYVVAYGAEASTLDAPGAAWPQIDGSASDLIAALSLAAQLSNAPADFILATDGLVIDENKLSEAVASYVGQGYRFNYLPLEAVFHQNDLYLETMRVPTSLWAGTTFAAVLPVYAPVAGQAEVQLLVDGQVAQSESLQLNPGENMLVYPVTATREGVITLEATVNWQGDARPENNQSAASVEVFPPPRVLMVTNDVEGSTRFRIALADNGVQMSISAPDLLPTNLELLEPYQVIILHNLLAEQLSPERVKTLEIFAAQHGGGVIFLGGRNAYTLGGYQGTPIEQLLPVKLEAPPRQERPPVTFVLVLDKSGSMARSDFSDVLPIDLAREAALRSIEALQPQDYLGVLTYSSDSVWNVDVRQLGDGLSLRLAQDAVGQVQAGGGTNMYRALTTALETLRPLNTTDTRHILLFSDGQSSDGSPDEFLVLAEDARNQDISISTISLGSGTNVNLLKQIAEVGKGRFFEVLDPTDLPRILVAESQAARGDNVQPGVTGLLAGEERHPVLGGFSQAEFPALAGYVALSSKAEEGSEDILLSANFGDPILSAWQYGLGRVVAWTSDLGEEWGDNWSNWARQGEFWAQMVRFALPDPSLREAQIAFSEHASTLQVDVNIRNAAGVPTNFLELEFVYVDAEGQQLNYRVPQTSPGAYQLQIPRPPIGAYRGLIRYEQDELPEEIPAPFIIPYPEEWQPMDSQQGLVNLESWTSLGDGGLTSLQDENVEVAPPVELQNNDTIRWLLLLLVLLWPLEIALRRRWMPWQVTEV
ncbi:MAG: VWA domain-containing protein [Chloroflexi bacterium]|nr:VWA domain-containing protein [Chloroflexota bacterium]